MTPKIKELYDESFVEKIESNDYNGSPYTIKEFDPSIFANKILSLCQGFAISEMVATDWQSHDDMTEEERGRDATAVRISGRINILKSMT